MLGLGLTQHDSDAPGPVRRPVSWWRATLVVLAFICIAITGFLLQRRFANMERELIRLQRQVYESETRARAASDTSQAAVLRASRAEESAQQAAQGRVQAEQASEESARQAEQARQVADAATQQAQQARAEADRMREQREAELARLHKALGKIADTQRTALGLVMTLGNDSIKFDFDKADLKPQNRELLSRIAGVLLTAYGFRIQVYGHTDDVGTEDYNQGLSERRATSVRNYLVEAGVDPEIVSMRGYGKSSPRVRGTDGAARARNRRVEIAVIDSIIHYEVGKVASSGK